MARHIQHRYTVNSGHTFTDEELLMGEIGVNAGDGSLSIIDNTQTVRKFKSAVDGETHIIQSIEEPSEEYRDGYLWLQDTDEQVVNASPQIDIQGLYNMVMNLSAIVNRHEYAFNNEMNCGKVTDNSTRRSMMMSATPEAPEGYFDGTQPRMILEVNNNTTIDSVVTYYLSSNLGYGVTSDTEGWSEVLAPLDSTNKYLWVYRVISHKENSESELTETEIEPELLTIYDNIRIIENISNIYALSDSSETFPDAESDEWSDSIPSNFDESKPYLWSYVKASFTNNNQLEPDYSNEGYGGANVKHLVIKSSNTEQEIRDNINNILNNELVWCEGNKGLYIKSNNRLIKINGASSIAPDEEIEEIMAGISFINDGVSAIDFYSTNNNKYTMKVSNEGELKVYPSHLDDPDSGYVNKYGNGGDAELETPFINKLYINSVYCGGDTENDNEHSIKPCSHNFVELSNLTDKDINLNGFYLHYASQTTGQWKKLPLWGVIPSNGTFLIRGAQCSVMNSNVTVIKVNDYDMEWNLSEKVEGVDILKPIKFNTDVSMFYLSFGQENEVRELYKLSNNKVTTHKGYVDLVGFSNPNKNENVYSEQAPYKFLSQNNLLRKYYAMDNVKQANKDFNARKNSTLWYYINLTKNNIIPNVESYTPCPSFRKKSFNYDKTKFKEIIPSTVMSSFGIQATDNSDTGKNIIWESENNNEKLWYRKQGKTEWSEASVNYNSENNKYNVTLTDLELGIYEYCYGLEQNNDIYFFDIGATRCFNWVSKGYYDEFIWYKKLNEGENLSIDSEDWRCIESYKGNDEEITTNNEHEHGYHNNDLKSFYVRIQRETSDNELCTSHKVIIRKLTAGTYAYFCGKKDENGKPLMNGVSKIYKFIVRTDDDVNNNGFSFVHVTDQQGFNWDEYQVWKYACKYISEDKDNVSPHFTINTGDATQNGNRTNEWLDYFNNREYLSDLEEMYTIGNNDLCPSISYNKTGGNDIDKINPINITYYYTFEINPKNLPVFNIENKRVYVPSLYSFNYGKHYFMCINSEISGSFEENMYNIPTGTVYEEMKTWCENDIKINLSDGWRIAYCHEMPFTILTNDTLTNFSSYWTVGPDEKGKNYPKQTQRGGSRLNTNVQNNKYWFSKFCNEKDIRLVLGGHKHTQAITYPLIENYDANINLDNADVNTIGHSTQPTIQITENILNEDFNCSNLKQASSNVYPRINGNYYPETWFNDNENTIQDGYINQAHWCKFTKVDKITAPVYAMSQATGYKHTSNKELPNDIIPWCRYFYPNSGGKANTNQKMPFYTYVNVENDKIELQVKRLKEIMSNGNFNINTDGERCKNNFNVINSTNGLSPNSSDNKGYIINK